MKIAVLIAQNTYETTSYFAQGLLRAFVSCNAEAKPFFVEEGKERDFAASLAAFVPDLTISFSDITVGEEPLGAVTRIPHFSFLLDPAIYSLHQCTSSYSTISCVDEGDVPFLRSFGFSNVCFLPHAIDDNLLFSSSDRPHDIAFFGSCIDYLAVESSWRDKYSSSTCQLLQRASKRVLSSEGISILKALVDEKVEPFYLAAFHDEVDKYTRGKDRIDLIRSLAGLPITIWGGSSGKLGWRDYLGDQKGCSIRSEIGFHETLQCMRQSKIVLNSSPRFKRGMHERILAGIVSGAQVFSGENDYIKAQFPHLPMYEYGEYKHLKEKVAWHLSSPQEEIINRHKKLVLNAHTWKHRAETILKISEKNAKSV